MKQPQMIEPDIQQELILLGKQLRTLRKQHGYTNYKEFAEAVGLHPNSILRIETGAGNVSLESLVKIVSAFSDAKLSIILRKAGL